MYTIRTSYVHYNYILFNSFQNIEPVPSIDCNSDSAWTHGSSLINYMKFSDFTGLSGRIRFDTYGRRTNFYLDVLELQATGLETIGTRTLYSYIRYKI